MPLFAFTLDSSLIPRDARYDGSMMNDIILLVAIVQVQTGILQNNPIESRGDGEVALVQSRLGLASVVDWFGLFVP